jgi:serine protease Do
VILDTEGHILTNNHVVAQAEDIKVVLPNGESHTAQLIGRDPNTNIAVIKIDAPGLNPAELGDMSGVRVGEEVIAIGHALGLKGGPTVSKGVVSALDRTISTGPQVTLVDLIQTDASINPGNSGGPLVDMNAQVIGINTAGIPSSQGIGFAVNINDAMLIATQLIETGSVERGFLGIVPVK